MTLLRNYRLRIVLGLLLALSIMLFVYSWICAFSGSEGPASMQPPPGAVSGTGRTTPGWAGDPFGLSLSLYAYTFFGLFTALSYFFLRGRLRMPSGRKGTAAMLLLACLALKLAAAPWITAVHGQFASEEAALWEHSGSVNSYLLYLSTGLGAKGSGNPAQLALLKLPSILADTATGYVLYRITRRWWNNDMGMLLASFYMLNPAVLLSSTFWGQTDSLLALLLVFAVWLLSVRRYGGAAALLALTVLVSAPLMLPLGPVCGILLLLALLRSSSWRAWLYAVLGMAAVSVPLLYAGNIIQTFSLWFASAANKYAYASLNAYNLFTLLGANYKNGEASFLWLTYTKWGLILGGLTVLYTVYIYWRSQSTMLLSVAASMLFAGLFAFSSGIDERVLYPAIALVLLGYSYYRDRRLLWLAFGFSTTIFLNTYAVYYGYLSKNSIYSSLMLIVPLINIGMYFLLGKVMCDRGRKLAR